MKLNTYQHAADVLLQESGCTVHKWRTQYSGVARTRSNDWGIESPRPTGPVSFGIFAHEVGHQVLHRNRRSEKRWIKETEAWDYALEQFERFDLAGRVRIRTRATRSVDYAFHKAINRGANPDEIRQRYPEWWEACLLIGRWLVYDGHDLERVA